LLFIDENFEKDKKMESTENEKEVENIDEK
jgi:hypothetical protein